ncbi:IclR family transcriptional regulator [Amycolatopsis rhabdoformis]|uniref:IclR family transcriptional regulator n=1 Tax=Amycolatopsis rhabdoformis TaxID=1448059 RepID=A0ABZ1IGQ6_9PSEU|nr:IclR family transcriptional regulator [Amycolatopsis rhabdoformis]WSE33599.1 IclR family transcriptional regulator [Amycolatopsis rhabdoformis]
MSEVPKYPIESVDRALRLLAMFKDTESLSLSDVAAELEVTRSTAHRLMAMFAWYGYADQAPQSKEYVAGPALLELSIGVARRLRITDRAQGLMQRVSATIDETIHLVMLNRRQVTFIDGIESTRALRAGLRVGNRLPAHATASGKALLAALPDAQVADLFPDPDLTPVTPHTVATLTALRAQLATVRERGFSASEQESEPGLVAISAVLPGRTSAMNLALSVAMPSVRADEAAITRVGTLLRSVIDESSAES